MTQIPIETTLFSLSRMPPSPDCRFDDERHGALFRVGALEIGDRRELCLIKTVSAGGMMIRAYAAIAKGTRLLVELPGHSALPSQVMWCRGLDLGVAFDHKADILELLTDPANGRHPRMPRIEVDCRAALHHGTSLLYVKVIDISQGGIKIRDDANLPPGSAVVVTLSGMAPLPAKVRWNDGDCSGVTFNAPMPPQQLMNWLIAQRALIERTTDATRLAGLSRAAG